MWSILIEIVLASGLIFLLGIAFGKFCQLSNDDRDDFTRPRLVTGRRSSIGTIKQRRMNK